ncbi:hypothetical protein [Luteimicrobium subarcticum]|uniref:Uncharacterized protein n=1 Tax=Luteimicrobium subarcticum TaxID=620910 RepID=A0A2M8WW07_9MICO|nr:hypothetical protein [Luteimicrobium subarcticum]PJI95115.1 hypothetical protein CLV34_0968 [Luteimicrobium subarcticum]
MSQPPTPPTPPDPTEPADGAHPPADEIDEDTTPRHRIPQPPTAGASAPEPAAAPGAAAAEPRWAPAPAPGFVHPVPPGPAPVPAQAQAPAPAPAGAPAGAPTVLTGGQVGRAAARAGVGYGVLIVASFLLCLLTLLVSALSGHDSSSSATTWSSTAEDASGGLSILTLPFVLAGAALLGPLHLSGGSDLAGTDVTLFLVPLGLTAALVVAILACSLLLPTRPTSVRAAWLAALATGATLAVGAGVLTAIFHVSVSDSDGFGRLAADPLLAGLGALLLGTVAAALGEAVVREGRGVRVDLRRLGIPLPAALSRAVVAAVVGYGVALVLVVLGFFVWLAVSDDGGLGAAVLATAYLGLSIGALGLGVGGFGGVTAGGEASIGASGGDTTLTLFTSGSPAALWLLLLAVVIGTFLTAAALARGGASQRRWQDAWATPTVLAVATLAALLLTGVTFSAHVSAGDLGQASGSGHARLAAWTFLVAALWGGLAEVLARTVVGALVPASTAAARTTTPTGPVHAGAGVPVTGAAAEWTAGSVPPGPGQAGPGGPVPGAGNPRGGMSRGAALAVLGGLGGLVVLVVVAAVGWHVLNASHGPEKQVEAYLGALSDGKPSKAFEIADPAVPDAQRALLTDDVYGDVAGRPSDVKVTEVEVDGDRAVVTARYDLAGDKATDTYTLHKDGHEDGVFDHWVMDPPELPEVPLGSLPEGTTSLVVTGHEVEVDASTDELAALPGTWTVALPDQGPYLESSTATYRVGGESQWTSSTYQPLEYKVTDAALQEATKQSKDALTACLATKDPEPDDCAIKDYYLWDDDAVDMRWTLDTAPTFTAKDEGYDDMIRVEVSDGKATFSYTLPKSASHYRDKTEHHADDVEVDYAEYYQVKDGKVVLDDRY